MNKAKIIKEIIGKRINPYGFQYVKSENLRWIFLREARGSQDITTRIMIL